MQTYNKVILAGYLTADPELTTLPSGTTACKVTIATNERWKDKDGSERSEAMFLPIVLYGGRADAFGKFCKKGSPVLVDGSLRYNTWDDKATGQKRSRHVLQVNTFSLLGQKPTAAESDENDEYVPEPIENDIPF